MGLGRVIPWEMGPHFPEKQRLGLGLGGCANHQPFPENLCAHSSVDAGTETQTELKLILAQIACEANSRTWMHENQATETAYPARPLNVNQAGVQKHFRQFAFLNLQFFWFIFVLHCVFAFAFFVHLWFPFFCIFFLQLLLFAFLRSIFFALHAAFFQDSKFLR